MAKTQPDTFHKIIISQEETIAQQKFLIEKYAEALAVKEFLNSDYKKENEQLRKALIYLIGDAQGYLDCCQEVSRKCLQDTIRESRLLLKEDKDNGNATA